MANTLSCIIIDDEPPAIRVLEKFTQQLKDLELLASFTNPLEALSMIQQQQPEIVFLDIQMPNITGIQFSKLIDYDAHIIFTTAYAQFAVEGFQLNAIDYLLKPIAFPRFIEAIEKVKKREGSTQKHQNLHCDNPAYFFIKTDRKNKFKKVDLQEILYIESIKNYVVIHTKAEQIVSYNALKNIQETLSGNRFVQIHKSYIVALDKVQKTDNHEVWVHGKELPLGDTYKSDFFQKINEKKL